ncbi:MAG: two-component system response regulator [endosymbiont of Galathealinum brachiosum]|uniref:Two-component system response regulator n=1 Tax=endosymbiont of Galathealinum brachiosum TaxID=2200906 RepID=A0A370D9R7_9GAMM|nr:MAG: two-component system response regulator [endosymbiont of Galathealinum brachiosum]
MTKRFKILIVDDVPKNIQVIANLLGDEEYDISYATNGQQALGQIDESRFDLVLLDIMMPGMDGYDVCRQIKNRQPENEIPIIFITAKTDEESLIEAFEAGGQDYITKPFNAAELIARVKTHLKLKAFEDSQQIVIDNALAELKVLNKEIIETQKEVIFTMGSIGETRSKETGLHVKRVAEYSRLLACMSGLNEVEADVIAMASPMHDIGKVGIPDAILNKKGRLTEDEFEVMKTHAVIGYDMLKHSDRPLMRTAAIIALEHHEKWDGTGYPEAASGNDIHIYGRITALADVFDALGSDRCYKKAWDDEKIFELLKNQSGKHFDPLLINVFFENIDQFLQVRFEYKDIF